MWDNIAFSDIMVIATKNEWINLVKSRANLAFVHSLIKLLSTFGNVITFSYFQTCFFWSWLLLLDDQTKILLRNLTLKSSLFLYPEINLLSQKGTSRIEPYNVFSHCNNSLLRIKMDVTTFKVLFEKTAIRQVKESVWEKGNIYFIPLDLSQANVYLKLAFFNPMKSIPKV